jgi:pectinesterase
MLLRLLLAAVMISIVARAQDVHVRVSAEVKTGIESTTEYPTIQMALDHHPFAGIGPDGKPSRVFIEIAPGTYHERIIVTQNHTNITLLGRGRSPEDVVITNSLNAKQAGGTFFTETVEINGAGFEADNITFENTAGNTGQAVAVADRADRSVFKHCRFLGHQDTLFADYGRQYYVDSYIEGGVDFIFGNATAVFDHTELHANGPGYLTAQSRTSPDQATGYVILNSRIVGDFPVCPGAPIECRAAQSFFLGRPWRPFSLVVVMHTVLTQNLSPLGWSEWKHGDPTPVAFYAEFENSGPGWRPKERASWSHQLTPAEAAQFTLAKFLAGPDHWDPEAEAAKLP